MSERYYVALVAPAVMNDFKLDIQQRLSRQFGLSSGSRSPAHVTLVAPFELGSRRAHGLEERFLSLAARNVIRPINAKLGAMTAFGHADADDGFIIFPMLGQEVAEVKKYVELEFGDHGADILPHLTLAKLPKRHLSLALGEVKEQEPPLQSVTFHRMALFRKQENGAQEVANVPFREAAAA